MSLISVKNLTKSFSSYKKQPGLSGSIKSLFKREYQKTLAVNDISFEIKKGELVGFIGPNGAGKTTTLKCLSGLIYPTSGSVHVADFKPFDRKNEFLKKISLVMGQKNQLWWDLPPMESFLLNKEIYEVEDTKFKKIIDELTELLDIKDVLNIQVRKLSLGQRMKCELVGQLIHSPEILFLDEPTIGLDVVMQENLREFIKEYNTKFEATILLTSHYMEDVKKLCKRVIIIDHGKIMYDGELAPLVRKYSKNKILTITVNKEIPKDELSKYGTVKEYSAGRAVIAISREDTNHVTAKILDTYDIDEFTVEEPSIEDVVRKFFSSSY
ncbi:ABC transporter [Candidatus Roizmanbacteria bacterium RIFCSPHIGHO2_02_FULL_40_13b]|nr:MAG: ABC transporter [Candidatus Roizmanbacteria bacterium RIFCSPHIGHO2_02_FULL_40_13b]OGK56940.1 MAG: ABC transporter [Candidatus Roizmanbacteria bacterium RIFCSPLOWO2_02_FULL_39_8]